MCFIGCTRTHRQGTVGVGAGAAPAIDRGAVGSGNGGGAETVGGAWPPQGLRRIPHRRGYPEDLDLEDPSSV